MWSYCSKELNNNRNLEFEPTSSARKAIAALSPKEKETILDCLKGKSSTSNLLRAEEEESWLNKYQYLLPKWSYVPRRYLRRKRRHKRRNRLIISPIQGPALSPNSLAAGLVSRISTTSPTPSPSPSPSPVLQAPNLAIESPAPVPEKSPFPPKEPIIPPSSSDDHNVPVIPQNSDADENRKYAVAAIVAGVVAGVSLFALFLLCCLKRNKSKVEPKEGLRDENPLLNLSGNDLLAGMYMP